MPHKYSPSRVALLHDGGNSDDGLDHVEQGLAQAALDEKRDLYERPDTLWARWQSRLPAACSWETALATMISGLVFLIPLHIRNFRGAAGPWRSTSWLDGLRGLASWWVLNTHLNPILDKSLGAGWGADGKNHNFLQLPYVRLVNAGHQAVLLFFIISGYALSLSAVSKMNKPRPDAGAALRSVASSIIRRPTRLYVPAVVSTILAMFIIRSGAIEWVHQLAHDSATVDGWEVRYTRFPTGIASFWDQLVHLYQQDSRIFRIFAPSSETSTTYNPVLWTIAVEFRASLFLYVVHMGLFFVRRPLRLALTFAGVVLTSHLNYNEMPMFLAGFFFCDLQHGRPTEDEEEQSGKRWTLAKIGHTAFFTFVLLLGGYVLSMPGFHPETTPGYVLLSHINPLNEWGVVPFWHQVGSILIIWALSSVPMLRWPLGTALFRYLGKISFALYLVHFPLVTIFGPPWYDFFWGVTGVEVYTLWYYIGTSLAYVLTVIPIFWVADLFWRVVDEGSITIGKRLEDLLVREEFRK